MGKSEKMLKSKKDNVALQNRIQGIKNGIGDLPILILRIYLQPRPFPKTRLAPSY